MKIRNWWLGYRPIKGLDINIELMGITVLEIIYNNHRMHVIVMNIEFMF